MEESTTCTTRTSTARTTKDDAETSLERSGYRIRRLEKQDHRKGFLDVLSQLATVGSVDEETFGRRYDDLRACENHVVMVIERAGRCVATATLLVEPKFVHGCSSVGHIEDVVVDRAHRGKGLGKWLLSRLVEEARRRGCYKVSLDSLPQSVRFYRGQRFVPKKEMHLCRYLR